MARAKRTDRADARRRYRATQAEVPDVETDDDDPLTPSAGTEEGTSGQGSTAKKQSQPRSAGQPRPSAGPAPRPSFTSSFRAAARPFNIRSDIAYIPDLVLHTRAVWAPALAAVGSGIFFLVSQPLGSNGIANLLFQLFVLPPTIAGSFLAGILAPRATYIAGGIAALVGALVFTVALYLTPINVATAAVPGASPTPAPSATASAAPADSGSPSVSAAPSPSPNPSPVQPLTDADRFGAALQALLVSVPFGVAIGAFGGYYKRFLYASNPARQRRQLEQQRQKAQRGQQPKKRY